MGLGGPPYSPPSAPPSGDSYWDIVSAGRLQPTESAFVACGAGTPDHEPGTGGLYVPGAAQVDGAAWFKTTAAVTGALTVTGAVNADGGIVLTGNVTTKSNADLALVPNGTGIVKIGDGTAYAFSSPTNGDLSVGRLGVKGTSYFGALTYMGAYLYVSEINADQASEKHHSTDLIMVRSGAGGVVGGFHNPASPDKGFVIHAGIDGYGNNALRMVAYANRAGDYGHTVMLADPTQFWFSRTAAATSTAQWYSVCHNTAHAVRSTGLGGIIDAPTDGRLYHDTPAFAKPFGGTKVHHSTVTLATDSDTTAVFTPTGKILHAAHRVSSQITGLDSADHHALLGTAADTDKYGDASQGSSSTTIDVNKKAHYAGDVVRETAQIVITITGGSDNIPSGGAVEVYFEYIPEEDIPSV